MNNTIQIPIKSYLKKMLIEYYDCYPFVLDDESDPIKRFISQHICLTFVVESDRTRIVKENKYDDTLQLECLGDIVEGFNLEISIDSMIKINKYMIRYFDRLLSDYVTPRMSSPNGIRDAIFEFMEFYDITDDDIDYDSLRKKFYRHRLSKASNKRKRKKHTKKTTSNGTLNIFNQN